MIEDSDFYDEPEHNCDYQEDEPAYDWQAPLDRSKEGFQWLINLPCVLRGEVKVDVRGPWPILIRGLAATTCMTKQDVVDFIIQIVP